MREACLPAMPGGNGSRRDRAAWPGGLRSETSHPNPFPAGKGEDEIIAMTVRQALSLPAHHALDLAVRFVGGDEHHVVR